MASMKGRITLATRQVSAERQMSSMVAFLDDLAFFSASMATSRPILLRCLKQAEHGLRQLGGNGRKAFVLRAMRTRSPVDATRDLFQLAGGCQARESDSGCPDGVQIAGAQHASLAGQIENALVMGAVWHVRNMFLKFF